MAVRDVLRRVPYIPVVTVERAADAGDLVRALADGGLPVVEITLRTPEAMAAIEAAAKVDGIAVGVGTVLDPADFARSRDAGAVFAVSPGLDADLVAAAADAGIDYLPGIQTASEAQFGLKLGLDALKFFPAKAAGGPGQLSQLAPVYPGLVFCPTGGIGIGDAPDYLALGCVACVGGSHPAPADLIRARDWAAIRTRSAEAAALRRA